MKILELLTPQSTDTQTATELARMLYLLSNVTEHPLVSDDELQLALRLADMAADPRFSPSTLVRDFIIGVNAKLAVGVQGQ